MGDFAKDMAAVQDIPAVPTLLDVVRRVTGMRFIAIARVTPDRWMACATKDDLGFGLEPGGELPIDTTICREVMSGSAPVIIDDVERDPVYGAHPAPALYGFKSYISMPIKLPDGQFFGTLCAIDPNPANVSRAEVVGMFQMFAELIGMHLDMAHKLAAAETALDTEKDIAEARERFVAVLGHDLRNPLAAIKSGLSLLARSPLEDRAKQVLGYLDNSVDRMNALIENLLDLARGRLAGGVPIARSLVNLDDELSKLVREIEAAHPDRTFDVSFTITKPVMVDPGRIGQLMSNLLHNAVLHGAPDRPISVSGRLENDHIVLSVANSGPPIPQSKLDRIFEPFNALETRAPREGLGLGLYIAREISRAHHGTLNVSSSPEETRFTFSAPASDS